MEWTDADRQRHRELFALGDISGLAKIIADRIDQQVLEQAYNAVYGAQPMPDRDVSDATKLEEAAIDVHRHAASLMDELTVLERRVDLVTKERKRIAAILKAFRDAPISMSSLQPVLQLADELNR